MQATLTILLAAHLVGRGLATVAVRRRQGRRDGGQGAFSIGVRALFTAPVAAFLLGAVPVGLLLSLVVSYAALELLRAQMRPMRFMPLLGFQLAYLAVIVALSSLFPGAAEHGFWRENLSVEVQCWYLSILTVLAGLLLCVPFGGEVIAALLRPLIAEVEAGLPERKWVGFSERPADDDERLSGLRNGGRYIGWLERGLVFILLLIGQPEGIGFLVAAKSILRFGEVRDSRQRRMTEYIIIGTFLSFGWALLIAYATQQALKLWACTG